MGVPQVLFVLIVATVNVALALVDLVELLTMVSDTANTAGGGSAPDAQARARARACPWICIKELSPCVTITWIIAGGGASRGDSGYDEASSIHLSSWLSEAPPSYADADHP